MAIILRWNKVLYARNDFVADTEFGRFRVKRVPRRRKDPWQASFKGEMRTGPNSITKERWQNYIATEAEAKAICEQWANEKKSIGSCLIEINAARAKAVTK